MDKRESCSCKIGWGPRMRPKVSLIILALHFFNSFASAHLDKGASIRSFDRSCTNLLWLVGFQTKAESGGDVFYLADNDEYVQHLKVAILSAQKNAPALIPVIVFAGSTAGNAELNDWILEHGGYVLQHKPSFYKDLRKLSADPKWSFSQNLWGSWLRVDIKAVLAQIEKMMGKVISDGVEVPAYSRENILWTDPDVIFEGPIDSCTLPRPLILSIGPEAGMGTAMNYGVIYFNVSGFSTVSMGMLEWAKQREFHFEHDQDLMGQYIGSRVNSLPDAYNWKLYWGNTTSARKPRFTGGDIKILHFHGPKLTLAMCFFGKLKAFRKPEAVSNEDQWDIVKSCGLKTPAESKAGDGSYGHLATQPYVQTLAHILFQAYKLDQGVLYHEVDKKFRTYQELI